MTTAPAAPARATNIRADRVFRPGHVAEGIRALRAYRASTAVLIVAAVTIAMTLFAGLLCIPSVLLHKGDPAQTVGVISIVFLASVVVATVGIIVSSLAFETTEKHSRPLTPLYDVLDVDLERRSDEAVWKAAGLAIKLYRLSDRISELRAPRVLTKKQKRKIHDLSRKADRLEARIAKTLGVKVA